VCALAFSGWVIGLLIRGRAGADGARRIPLSAWSPVLADGEAAAASFLATRDRRGGALRQTAARNSWAEGAFGCARTLLDFGIGRSAPLLDFI